MDNDPVRERVRDGLRHCGFTLREASLALGRNVAYLHQFLNRGSPRALAYRDVVKLAELLGCDPETLHHERVPKRKSAPRPRRFTPPEAPGAPLAGVPELDVTATAGAGAFNPEAAVETARWCLPEAMLRHEGSARPEDLRILRVRGDSMEPLLREGDRLLVDIARRTPATGEMAVLWDGTGPHGQAGRYRLRRRLAPAAASLRQPRLSRVHLPHRGSSRRRQGTVDGQEGVKVDPCRLLRWSPEAFDTRSRVCCRRSDWLRNGAVQSASHCGRQGQVRHVRL